MVYTVRAFFNQEQNPSPWVLATPDDVDALIDAVLAGSPTNSVIALYVAERPKSEHDMPDHELRVAINQDTKVGGVRYSGPHNDAAGVWYTPGLPSERDEVFYYYMGHDEGWPHDSEVPIDTVRAAAKELLALGGRPSNVDWQEWPRHVG